jgi:tetratricopeptide (TPR) repeat protein
VNEALTLAREVKNQTLVAQNLNFQGDVFFYRGDTKEAEVRYRQALQSSSQASDRRLGLISKFNLARIAAVQGHSRAAISSLRGLSDQADAAGLKFLSVECSVFLGKALFDTRDFPRAREELNRALARSEKLGSQSLQAQSHYLLATVLRLSGEASEAQRHYSDTRRILDAMSNEAKSDTFLKRFDLAVMYADATKWSTNQSG